MASALWLRPAGILLAHVSNRSRYDTADLVEIVRAAYLNVEIDRVRTRDRNERRLRHIVFDEWHGNPRALKSEKPTKAFDAIIKLQPLFDTRPAGIGHMIRLLRPELDKHHPIIERVAGLEAPEASDVVVTNIVSGVARLLDRNRQFAVVAALLNGTRTRVRVRPEQQPDDPAAIAAAITRYTLGAAKNHIDRADQYLGTLHRALIRNEKRGATVGCQAGAIERLACADKRYEFWLRVAREWEALKKTLDQTTPPKYTVVADADRPEDVRIDVERI